MDSLPNTYLLSSDILNIDKEIIDKAANLKFIGRVGSGMEGIDVRYAEKKGIKCLNSPEGNRDAVGEHALGMLVALMNNFIRADKQVRSGQWKREENMEIPDCSGARRGA